MVKNDTTATNSSDGMVEFGAGEIISASDFAITLDYDPDIQHKIDSLNDEANVLYKKAFDNTKKIIS